MDLDQDWTNVKATGLWTECLEGYGVQKLSRNTCHTKGLAWVNIVGLGLGLGLVFGVKGYEMNAFIIFECACEM